MIRPLGILCAIGAFLSAPAAAFAQDTPLSELIVNLVQSDVRLEPPSAAGFASHEAHFLPGTNQQLAPYLFNQQLVLQLATFPIGSPSGGFSFDFDSATGTFTRATNSFGPAFAERALTNGYRRLTVGANFQYSKYNSFEGKNIDDDSIKFYLAHQDIPGDNFFEGDVVETALRLDVSSATTTLFANYGVTDELDVSVAVPMIHVNVDATIDARILRLATGENTTNIHSFAAGASTGSFSDSGSATGIGDILLRAKYRFLPAPGGGLAAGVDVRLPSGDESNLLGTGAAAATFTLIGSSPMGRLAPHFNIAFTGSGTSDLLDVPNEFTYKFGSEFVPGATVTLNADVIGRTLVDAGRLQLTPVTRTFRSNVGVPGSITLEEYQLTSGNLNLISLALGGKFNVGGNFLINANVLVPLNDAGVTAKVTPVIGFDYSF
jgi:hypothetical protein